MKPIKSNVAAFLVILAALAPAYTQQSSPVTKEALIALSGTLAYDMGTTYQKAHHCRRELASIAPARATVLFLNYFDNREVQAIMSSFEKAMGNGKAVFCDLDEIKVPALLEKIGNYMRIAAPFTRSHSER